MPEPPVQGKFPRRNLQSRSAALPAQVTERQSSVYFVRVEKNLASLGFFTPSNKKIKGVKSKTILFNRQVEGQRIEVKAVILPSAAYGLPITTRVLACSDSVSDQNSRKQEGQLC